MKLVFGILFLLALRSEAFVEASQIVDIDMLDSSQLDCWMQEQRVNYITDTAFGLRPRTRPSIRVRIPFSIVQEEIVGAGLKLVAPGYEIFDLGSGSVVIDGKAKATYSFMVPKEVLGRMGKGARFQAQVLILTKKNEYLASRSIRTFHVDETIEAYYPQGQCFFNTPAIVVSDLYENRNGINALDIEYVPRFSAFRENSQDISVGILQASNGDVASPSAIVSDTLQSNVVSGEIYTTKEWRAQMESSDEVQQAFTLAPRSYGYIVRQDVVVVTRVQRLTFNKCGILTGRKEDVVQRENVLPAFTLMSLSSTAFNDFEKINQKLLSYPLINTCQSGGEK